MQEGGGTSRMPARQSRSRSPVSAAKPVPTPLPWPAADRRRSASRPAIPSTQQQIVLYEHFVATPVPIGAATNPMAMLSPLSVTVER